MPPPKESLFLNIPFDSSFRKLYVAYIAVFTQLCNAFVRLGQPTMRDMEEIYLRLADLLPLLLKQTGSDSPFEARIFRDLVVAARALTRHQDFGSR